MGDPTELIIVCCHAVYTGHEKGWRDESNWILQDFQRSNVASGKRGEHETFVAHITAGVMRAAANPKSLLVFSGGQTTSHPRSEAAGYAMVLSGLNLPNLHERLQLEEWSTDSFQNLLFSIMRFRRFTGHYPEQVTVVTHAFKEQRFLDLHAPAIRWPDHRIRVLGINPPFTADELDRTVKSERTKAYALFADDLYGASSALAAKRRARRWRWNTISAIGLDLETTELLYWNGGESGREVYPGPLPWSEYSAKHVVHHSVSAVN